MVEESFLGPLLHLRLGHQKGLCEQVLRTISEIVVHKDRVHMMLGEMIEDGPIGPTTIIRDKYSFLFLTPFTVDLIRTAQWWRAGSSDCVCTQAQCRECFGYVRGQALINEKR